MTYYKTGINLDDPKNMEDMVSSITTKDIRDFAKKFFRKADVVDLIFAGKKQQ